MSAKVASDIASRCLRVEKALGVNLITATRTIKKLELLHLNISEFVMNTADTRAKAHSLSAILRSEPGFFLHIYVCSHSLILVRVLLELMFLLVPFSYPCINKKYALSMFSYCQKVDRNLSVFPTKKTFQESMTYKAG